jgi:hypothetical protein
MNVEKPAACDRHSRSGSRATTTVRSSPPSSLRAHTEIPWFSTGRTESRGGAAAAPTDAMGRIIDHIGR